MSVTPARRRPSVPGVARAAAILTEIARNDGQAISSLAGNVGLAKSTTSDVTGTLVEQQLLTRDTAGQFHLGSRIDRLASSWVGQTGVLRRFIRACERQPGLSGHTVLLLVPQGSTLLCLDVRLGTRPLPQTPRPGMRFELAESAPGRALLRAIDPHALSRLLERAAAFEGLTPDFLTGVAAAADALRSAPGEAATATEPRSVAAANELPASTWVLASAHVPSATPTEELLVIEDGLRALLSDLSCGSS
ncbi:MAG: helix-turn-helix domain-containing protein [Propionibacteriaceae bacterium]|nr:helix-turn-helix domain-containing protein [Propionibacteriaceae bacterium]